MRRFAPRVLVLKPDDDFLRTVPPPVAEALLACGNAEVASANGRIREIKLIATAANSATRIGGAIKPTGPTSVKFSVREKLDSGSTVWRHHSRSFE